MASDERIEEMKSEKLTPLRSAMLERLQKERAIAWSSTTTQEAKTLNWLAFNGYATRTGEGWEINK